LDYNSDTNKALAVVDSEGHTRSGPEQRWEQVQFDMHALKLIRQRTVGFFKQGLRLSSFFANVLRHRRRQFALNALEAERLDRIRNPSKYLGR
jgi:hypothetical protein